MLLGPPQPHQDFSVARSDKQTGRWRGHRKRICVIHIPHVIEHHQRQPAFQGLMQGVFPFLFRRENGRCSC